MSNHRKRNEDGTISIDAVISITIFMLSILAIMMFSLIAQTQSMIQFALGQTAKEISGYYYMLDKIGLTQITSGKTQEAEDVDAVISNVFDFSTDIDSARQDAQQLIEYSKDLDNLDIQEMKNLSNVTIADIEKTKNDAKVLKASIEKVGEDPVGQLKAIYSVFAKTMLNKGLSYIIAPCVCRALMPRYLGGDREKANEKLKTMGIENGLEGLDFSQTELLADGRSIKLIVIYRLNPETATLGMLKLPGELGIPVRQVACTAAWIKPDGQNTILVKDTK